MTIEEAKQLRLDKKHKTLRKPNCMITEDEKELKDIHYFFNTFVNLMFKGVKNTNPFTIINKLTLKHMLTTNPIVESVKGRGRKNKPYILKTKYGEVEAWDAKQIFYGKYPECIERNYCFSNSFTCSELFAKKNYKGKMVTGIAYFEYPFLHSVLYVERDNNANIVIDFNLDIVMNADLYFKLFSFEQICVIDFKQVEEDWNLLKLAKKYLDFEESCYYLCIAYDDVVKLAKEKLAEENKEEGLLPNIINT